MQETNSVAGGDGLAPKVDLPRIVLQITRGRAKHRIREVRSSAFLIGTDPECDLVLGDSRFDAVYSYVLVRPGRVTIRQFGSGPALCVGGQPKSWAELSDLDRLQMGPYEFQVRIQWPSGKATAVNSNARKSDSLIVPVDREPAIQRLLREASCEAPRLTLFVGDEECEIAEPAPRRSSTDPAAWRPPQRKASS